MLKDRAGKENEGQVQLGKCRGCFCTLPRVTLLKETDFVFYKTTKKCYILHYTTTTEFSRRNLLPLEIKIHY